MRKDLAEKHARMRAENPEPVVEPIYTYEAEVWNTPKQCFETHTIRVFAPQPNPTDGLNPAAVGSGSN